MIFFLSFLLSWCSGFLMTLLIAFGYYDYFGVVDILSFAVFTFVASIVIIHFLYLTTLKFLSKTIKERKQFTWFPSILVLVTNLPVYIIIWLNINNLYGKAEAMLFILAFVTIAIVFGLSWAWKNNFRRGT